MNIGAFNLGNAVGAAVGGGVIAAGFGYPAVAIAGAVASALGLIAVIVSVRRNAAPARSRGAATLAADAS
jgi:DHA1 family inner membrane transport protein